MGTSYDLGYAMVRPCLDQRRRRMLGAGLGGLGGRFFLHGLEARDSWRKRTEKPGKMVMIAKYL